MTGKSSASRYFLEKDKEDAKKAREKNPEAFELPEDLSFIKKENPYKVELILPESIHFSKGFIKIEKKLVGTRIIFDIARSGNSKGKIILQRDKKKWLRHI